MKLKYFFVITVFALLLESCSSTQVTNTPTILQTSTVISTVTRTPAPTKTPQPTLIPCPKDVPAQVGTVTVYFHGDVNNQDCDMVLRYIRMGVEWFGSNGYEVGPAELHYAETIEEIVDVQLQISHESRTSVVQLWSSGTQGYAIPGYAFFAAQSWTSADLYGERVKTPLHELTHLEQYNLYGGKTYLVAPRLWLEGEAEYYGRYLTRQFGLEPASTRENLLKCTSTFVQAQELQTDPFGCAYMQGEQIFVLLDNISGKNKSLDVWKIMSKGTPFDKAFEKVYGFTYDEFGKKYDEFRLNKYKLP